MGTLGKALISAALVVTYWVVVLALPDKGGSWPTEARIGAGIVGAVLVVLAVARAIGQLTSITTQVAIALAVGGVVVIIIAIVTGHELQLDPDRRAAIGVGGTALGALVLGIANFNSLRAAAGLPVIVLVIGMATWPGGTVLDVDLRTEVLKWMGGLLAVAAGGEAVVQAAEAVATGRSQASNPSAPAVKTTGDLK